MSIGPFALSVGSVLGSVAAWYLYTNRLEVMPIIVAVGGFQLGNYLWRMLMGDLAFMNLTPGGFYPLNPPMQSFVPGGFYPLVPGGFYPIKG